MTRHTRRHFTGDLAKPMPRLDDVSPTQWLREHRRRMELLRKHLGVPEDDDWYLVASMLARMNVPGLREQERRAGAPTKWSGAMLALLKNDVDEQREAHSRWSLKRICEKLAQDKAWQERFPRVTAATLQRRYSDCTPEMLAAWKQAADFA